MNVVEDCDGVRRVEVESTDPPGCPVCGVLAGRVHSRRRQRLGDLPGAGPTEGGWVKRRWVCDQARCRRRTFSEVTDQVPAFARSTARLCQSLVAAVVVSGRAASEVARAHRVSWWLVASMLTAAADLIGDPDQHPVRRLGVDEYRYRSVRFFREPDGGWRRYEPWMTTLVDADTGRVVGVVDGRDSAGVGAWLGGRGPARAAWGRGGPPQPGLAERGGGGRDRPVGGLPQGAARTPAGRGGQRGRLPPGQTGQRHAHRRPPAGGPRAEGPPRTSRRPRLGQPPAAAARRQHPQPAGAGPAQGHPVR